MDISEMKIKGLAPWFGSKRNLAPVIVELIGDHRVYWEPFCGSMAVLLIKPPCEMETVNDLHGDLINLARVIQHKDLAFRLYDKLCRTLYAEKFFHESKERAFSCEVPTNDKPDLDRAYDYFVASWMGVNGVSGTKRNNYQFALRWSAGGGQGTTRWMSVVGSMPAWHKRLQSTVIIQRDAFEVLANIKDDEDVAIYCDPPYFVKCSKYVHDFEGEEHDRLADALKRFKKSRVLLSYYDHPRLKDLYKDWCRAYVGETVNSLRNAAGCKKTDEPKKKSKEVLLTNWNQQKEPKQKEFGF